MANMRNLRAELQQREENDPVFWNPAIGDILVGTVGGDPSLAADSGLPPVVMITEERTGVAVYVDLESPQLAALFELHRPQPGERIGIKCVGYESAGTGQFIVVVDRDLGTAAAPSPAQLPEQTPADDDFAAATPEERDYIERMLERGAIRTPAQAGSTRVYPSRRIEGMIDRGLDELDHQTRAMERLQALVVPPQVPPNSVDASASAVLTSGPPLEEPVAPVAAVSAVGEREQPANRTRNWLSALIIALCLLIAASAGPVLHFILPN